MKEKDEGKPDLSRRDFVRATTAGVGGIAAAAWAGVGPADAQAADVPRRWDKVADVVIVGAGAAGIPAAIEAAENGASVIVIEQNFDIGGHAIQSGAGMPLGGGTSLQKKFGVEDSPDRYFQDLINWHDYRFSDREIVRAFADWSAPTFEWLKDHGVVFRDQAPGFADGSRTIRRSAGPAWTGGVSTFAPTGANGAALMRPLEASASQRAGSISTAWRNALSRVALRAGTLRWANRGRERRSCANGQGDREHGVFQRFV